MHSLQLSENTILMVFSVAVGAASALGVVAFYKLIDLAFAVFFRIPSEQVSRSVFLAYRPIITALGLMTAWWIWQRFARMDQGMTVPDVQLAVARRGGYLPARPAVARTAASAVTLGSGGSAGSEGPVAVLGSAIGSWIGRIFDFDAGKVRVLVGSGAAAGIAAAFNAPLAGAFFALEEILFAFSAAAFAPVVISSVVGALVSRAFFGNHPAFPIPEEYGFALSSEIVVLYPLLGVICGVVAALFIRTHFRLQAAAERHRHHPLLLAGIGGAAVGVLVYLSQGILVGYGHLAVRVEVFGRMAWYALALLAAGKILATSLTLNLGGSGGVFTPSLYIGAATGGAFGAAVNQFVPNLTVAPAAYALVGMGAVVAAATDARITAILIVFEMTNDYAIVPALMLVVAIASVVARKLEPYSLYSGHLHRLGEVLHRPPRRDVFASVRVADVLDPIEPIAASATVDVLIERFATDGVTELPVINEEGRLLGIVGFAEVARVAREPDDGGRAIIASDLTAPTEIVIPQDTLLYAIEKMARRESGTLPVVNAQNGRLVGVITRRHILDAYERGT
ncbi:MAG TPA: chloride channel protein [Burkholderiales bacterium]|nr:chloride channel protein [Burkholderiales bacterium]